MTGEPDEKQIKYKGDVLKIKRITRQAGSAAQKDKEVVCLCVCVSMYM